jgi:hypothetical protein
MRRSSAGRWSRALTRVCCALSTSSVVRQPKKLGRSGESPVPQPWSIIAEPVKVGDEWCVPANGALCAQCASNRVTAASVADHVQLHQGDQLKFFWPAAAVMPLAPPKTFDLPRHDGLVRKHRGACIFFSTPPNSTAPGQNGLRR